MQASCASSSIQQKSQGDTVPSGPPSLVPVRSSSPASAETQSAPPARLSYSTIPYAHADEREWMRDDVMRHALPSIEIGDEEDVEERRPSPEWCVDLGSRLEAMTTFELWMALARGEIAGETTVWRDGMEGWDRVDRIPELAYAIADSVSFDPPLVAPAPLPHAISITPTRGLAKTPLTFGSADAQTGDPPDVGTIGLEGSELSAGGRPSRLSSFGRWVRAGFAPAQQSGLAFAMGCVVAAAALGLALMHEGLAPAVSSTHAAGAEPPTLVTGAGGLFAKAGRKVVAESARRVEPLETETEAKVVETPVEVKAPVEAPRAPREHKEPGQRRRSRRGRQR